MKPPVGKSGPGTSSSSFRCFSAVVIGASCWVTSIIQIAASSTSRRLCGGTFVAIPTAIPADPFTSRFGNGAGRTVGSSVVSS
jgi:hypothetical protein